MGAARDLRLQAAEWRRVARRHGGDIGRALRLAADLLDEKAARLEAVASLDARDDVPTGN